MRRYIGALLMGASVLLVAGCNPPSSGTGGANGGLPQGPKATADFSLTADDFQKEYDTDKQAAMKKYTNKTIELTGVVKEVYGETDPRVGLVAPKRDRGLPCVMAAKGVKPQVAKGQTVKIRGVAADFGEMPLLTDCVMVDPGPK